MSKSRVTVRFDPEQLQVDQLFSRIAPAQKAICVALRHMLLADRRVRETVKWGYPCYECEGKVAAIMPFKSYVNLQFFRGVELSNEMGLLVGTGKGMRHVSFRTIEEVRVPAVASLIAAAIELDSVATVGAD